METWTLAIDFGTTFTTAAVGRDGSIELVALEAPHGPQTRMPSAVFAREGGELVVGWVAENQGIRSPERLERTPKRRLGEDGVLLLGAEAVETTRAVSEVLRAVYGEACRREGGSEPLEVRLTHPASWATRRIGALGEAAARAGIRNPQFIAEPVAAALHLGAERVEPRGLVAVYDLGGGTFDTAIVRRTSDGFELVGPPGGKDGLGGDEFDQRLHEHVATQLAANSPADAELLRGSPKLAAELRVEVRKAKEALSRYSAHDVVLPAALELGSLRVTREELEQLIRRDVRESVDILELTIRAAGLRADDLAGIYLVGGSSRIPLASELIAERFGRLPDTFDEPKSVVALGAARRLPTGAHAIAVADSGRTTVDGRVPASSPGGGLSMWLTIRSESGSARTVRVAGDRFVVGRSPECGLMLPDDKVSQRHAKLSASADGGAVLDDLGSTNGTFVDGRRIEGPHVLRGGERLRFGDTVLEVSLTEPALTESARAPAPAAGNSTVQRLIREVLDREADRTRTSIRRATILAGIAALAVAAAGALTFTGALAGGGREASIAEVVDQVRPSTVQVITSVDGRPYSTGTGWVLDAAKGLIVTNEHVVNGGTSFAIGDGSSSREAELAGVAPCEDLAVLKVGDTSGLRTLPLGSQNELDAGETVVAVGYPGIASQRAELTATSGVVSIVRTRWKDDDGFTQVYPNVIQTDAAINPGNSGGPLVNLQGKLVGVNTLVRTIANDRIIQNQGYAIGVARVKEIVPQLASGRSLASLGLVLEFPVEESELEERGLPTTAGIIATAVVPGSPADKAGLGQHLPLLIVAIDGHPVDNTMAGYCASVGSSWSGDSARLTVYVSGASEAAETDIEFE